MRTDEAHNHFSQFFNVPKMVLDVGAVAVRNCRFAVWRTDQHLGEPSTAVYWITRSQSGGRTYLRNDGKCHISEDKALLKSDAPCIANILGAVAHFGATISSSVRHAETLH